jgi:hypothetical protein
MRVSRVARRGRAGCTAVSLAMISVAVLATAACGGRAGSSAPQAAPGTGGGCVPSSEQRVAIEAYYKKALEDYVPDGVRKTETIERTADCTTQWPGPGAELPPVKRFAALEIDYITGPRLTSTQLRATFGQKATAAGWQPNGGWDDSQGDGAAYASYCQKVAGMWAVLSIERGPAVDGQMPVRILIEGYPGSTGCPGRPQDG